MSNDASESLAPDGDIEAHRKLIARLLGTLAELDPRLARIAIGKIDGVTDADQAEIEGLSEREIEAEWRIARAWLRSRLRRD